MKRQLAIGLCVCGAMASALWCASADAGRGNGPVIYVYGQGLFYDSIVLTDLPHEGPFQQLEMGGPAPSGLQTEYGPGDSGYLGGRWWLDDNGDGVMDDDKYFSCPLLGPGRDAPE